MKKYSLPVVTPVPTGESATAHGYGEAVAGKRLRRSGLMRVVGETSGDGRKCRGVQAQYRRYLYGEGGSVNGRKDAAAALFARWCFAVKNKRKRGLSGQAVSKAARKRG